jgi:Na+-driven multidrug efflux pump
MNKEVISMDKRGQGLTLNTIVIAALVLIVLIVLILIFTGNLTNFVKQSNECVSQGGKCYSGTSCPTSPPTTLKYGAVCPEKKDASGAKIDQVCCVGLTGE